ncbi:hypothetical protein SARC_12933 [Sphaeroforma arctica JP610]|uniref:PH domain-containing protein n=1 Tax=Sphaeroforma arctica JP610 TaxID=667725 RepID=A0A0L0FCN5_9EUKA|nr:hypothetical protein SARC_12933 [Sphaeroforma arctica JP610]KNC74525.1 hypothetical protein SARC_12933 [Sphaeroforma arctica JP610]|eukprot:XP_014148427.1 hypothetical protein SARC_12933 [Sphaeroforma arctica JP610]
MSAGDWSAETGESAIPLTENGLILHRQGSKFFKRWRLVYCAIVNGELRLSTGPTSTPYVHLKLFGCHIEAQSKKRFGFTITVREVTHDRD